MKDHHTIMKEHIIIKDHHIIMRDHHTIMKDHIIIKDHHIHVIMKDHHIVMNDHHIMTARNYLQYRIHSPNREILSKSGELLCIFCVTFWKLSPESWPRVIIQRWVMTRVIIQPLNHKMTECVSYERECALIMV